MKIAISSSGDDLGAKMDTRFGRAAKFVVVDLENDSVEAFDNTQNLNAAQGAGIQSAETVCNLGADVLISGHCGPKAFKALTAAKIKVFCCSEETVGDALEAYKNGKLEELASADVEGHWI